MKFSKFFIALLIFLSACNSTTPATTPTGEATASNVPTVLTTITPNSTVTMVVTDTATATATPEVQQFSSCEIEKFWNCPVTEDMVFNDFLPWLQTQPSTFNAEEMSKLAPPVIRDEVLGDMGEVIWPDDASRGYFHPRYDLTLNLQMKGPDGVLYPSIIIPVEIYNKDNPAHSFWAITDESYYLPGYDASIKEIEAAINQNIPIWRKMKVVPMMTGTNVPGHNLGDQDPVALRTLANYPNKADMIAQFKVGKLDAFTVRGFVLLTIFDAGTLWH